MIKKEGITMNTHNYTARRIKKTVCVKDEPIMVINIAYPFFNKENQSKRACELAGKINRFYSHTAEKYTRYISEKYVSKALKIYNTNGHIKLSFVMDCTVSFINEGFVSIFSDLTYFNGKKKKTVRFSQNWSESKSALLPASFCFNKSGKAKKHITQIIAEIAEENIKSRCFSYFSDYPSIIARKFDFDNFYFVPNGTAFFYNPGILSDEDTPCVFVIPNKKIDGILKIHL